MRYWKGLAVAAAIDLATIAGCPAVPTDPAPPAVIEAVADPEGGDMSGYEDSVMTYLHGHPDDVDAMAKLARAYVAHGWYEAALRPLARGLQLDPSRRSLWVALDAAVAKSGRVKITDAELTRNAQDFVEAVEMWGMGC
jgi:predicted Zn-dependent protease